MTSSRAASTPEASTKGLIDAKFWFDEENLELNAYRLSKLSAEKLAWNLAEKYHFKLSTILPGAIFGPTLTDAISSNGLIAQIIHGTPLPMLGRIYTHTNAKTVRVLGYQPTDPRQTILDTARSLKEKNLL